LVAKRERGGIHARIPGMPGSIAPKETEKHLQAWPEEEIEAIEWPKNKPGPTLPRMTRLVKVLGV
jgi:hypothetical protein